VSQLVLKAVGGDLANNISLIPDADVSPSADDVVVAVEAAPINNADLLFGAGLLGVYPDVPAPLGGEGVGRVVQAGAGVDPALIGRRALILPTFRYGTWAATTVVPARNVIPVRANVDVLQLAMLGIPATAYALLDDFVPVQPGDWVGLNLANGAVGHCLIGLAKRAGIQTLGVVRRHEAAEEVRRAGADLVVVDGEDLGGRVSKALGDATLRVLFEGTGDPGQIAELVRAVKDGGSVIAFASATGQAPAIPLGDLFNRGISLRAFFILNWLRDTPREELERIFDDLADLIGHGVIRTVVEATYPLTQYREAVSHAQQSERSGKILFTPTAQGD
jgi:2-desacetyl-2-hydroxyethyl bacteriochlorophyllide A dehydrogenase